MYFCITIITMLPNFVFIVFHFLVFSEGSRYRRSLSDRLFLQFLEFSVFIFFDNAVNTVLDFFSSSITIVIEAMHSWFSNNLSSFCKVFKTLYLLVETI